MRDEIILSGPRYAVFHGGDAGCFKIDGGIEDYIVRKSWPFGTLIKYVVMFYKKGTSGNNSVRKEKFRAVLKRNYKTLRRIREFLIHAYVVFVSLFFLSQSKDELNHSFIAVLLVGKMSFSFQTQQFWWPKRNFEENMPWHLNRHQVIKAW